MRATRQKETQYYTSIFSYYYQDVDYDIGDTYTVGAGQFLEGMMCSHNSPVLEVYDGALWRAVELATGDNIRCVTADVMCSVNMSSGGGTQIGSLRIGQPGADDTTLTLKTWWMIKSVA